METKHQKRYLAGVLVAFLLTLAAAAFVNYQVDPSFIFRGQKYEKGIVDLLLKGKNVAGITNHNDRQFQRYYIESIKRKNDVVVLGSSRVMIIRTSYFPGKTLFNNWVPAATIEDLMAIYEMYHERGFIPSVVVIGVDPYIFNRSNGLKLWETNRLYYEKFSARLNLGEKPSAVSKFDFLNTYRNLFSLAYLKASIVALRLRAHGKNVSRYYPTDKEINDTPTRLTDGTSIFSRKQLADTPEMVRKLAVTYAHANPVLSMGNFKQIDPDVRKNFESFVMSMKKDGVQVIFYLAPYHPVAYETLMKSDSYRIIGDVQKYVLHFAERNGIETIGSYNPADCRCDETEFSDGNHPSKSCIDKIFGKLKKEN